MNADLEIRQYRDSDHDAVWDLHNEALNLIDAHGGNGPWDDDLHHIRQVYLESAGQFLVGTIDGRVVAMGALLPTGPAEAEIKRMRVAPALQRRGLGQAILSALIDKAIAAGITLLHLETTSGQIAARALYEKNCFVRHRARREGRFEVLTYRRELT